jgi:hypothetical protein
MTQDSKQEMRRKMMLFTEKLKMEGKIEGKIESSREYNRLDRCKVWN